MRVGAVAVLLAAMTSVASFAASKDPVPEEITFLPATSLFGAPAESAILPDAPVRSFVAETKPRHTAERRHVSLRQAEFLPAVSPVYSMPLVAVAMRLGGRNFNTDDGSSLDAFAICYRINRSASVQVIPGDPAPVKIPVVTMKNNMGVTVGMVYRLSRLR